MKTQIYFCFLVFIIVQVHGVNFYSQWYPLADEIISHMTLDQLIGQTLNADVLLFNYRYGDRTDWNQIKEFQLGSVQVSGNGCPDGKGSFFMQGNYDQASPSNWRQIADSMQKQTIDVETPNGIVNIKVLMGTDAVHGNQHILGEILFPHNIGFAATHNVQNFINAAYWNQKSVKSSGFNYAFAPTVAISHNPQWGRFYETLGDDPQMVEKYVYAYVKSLQQIQGKYLKGAVASTKHFLGDGATKNGYDEGNGTVYNMKKYLEVNLAGYKGALKANTGTIMVSYSATNNIPMSIYGVLIQKLLKDTMEYDALLISDYDAVVRVSNQGAPTTTIKMTIRQALNKVINSGMDIIMLAPNSETEIITYINYIKDLLNEKQIHIQRLNNMVRRIMAVKLSMQLVVVPDATAQSYGYDNPINQDYMISTDDEKNKEYDEALQAAQESLVLLKNQNKVLPLSPQKLKYVVMMGEKYVNNTLYLSYDNIGMQNGGWSIRWQGFEGNHYWSDQYKQMSRASSILDGLYEFLDENVSILKPDYGDMNDLNNINQQRKEFLSRLKQINDMTAQNTVIIGVFGESSYSEFMGDINNEYCKGTTQFVEGCLYNNHFNEYMPLQQKTDLAIGYDDFSLQILDTLNLLNIPLVSIFFSGRPMIVDQTISQSQAFVVAWQPGTTGGVAVANALFGRYKFKSNGISNTLPIAWIHDMQDLHEFPVYKGNDQPKLSSKLYPSGYGLAYEY